MIFQSKLLDHSLKDDRLDSDARFMEISSVHWYSKTFVQNVVWMPIWCTSKSYPEDAAFSYTNRTRKDVAGDIIDPASLFEDHIICKTSDLFLFPNEHLRVASE